MGNAAGQGGRTHFDAVVLGGVGVLLLALPALFGALELAWVPSPPPGAEAWRWVATGMAACWVASALVVAGYAAGRAGSPRAAVAALPLAAAVFAGAAAPFAAASLAWPTPPSLSVGSVGSEPELEAGEPTAAPASDGFVGHLPRIDDVGGRLALVPALGSLLVAWDCLSLAKTARQRSASTGSAGAP